MADGRLLGRQKFRHCQYMGPFRIGKFSTRHAIAFIKWMPFSIPLATAITSAYSFTVSGGSFRCPDSSACYQRNRNTGTARQFLFHCIVFFAPLQGCLYKLIWAPAFRRPCHTKGYIFLIGKNRCGISNIRNRSGRSSVNHHLASRHYFQAAGANHGRHWWYADLLIAPDFYRKSKKGKIRHQHIWTPMSAIPGIRQLSRKLVVYFTTKYYWQVNFYNIV